MAVETGLPDFYKMTLTVMKIFYKKQKPNTMTYWNYKHFSNETFMFDVKNSIIQMTPENNGLEFDGFKSAIDEAIPRHAPITKRYVRVNQAPFINKKLNKQVMKRSCLRHTFLNTKSDIGRKAYYKEHDLCASLIKSEKKNFVSIINTSDIADKKTFWKTVKPFFTDKIKTKSKITLLDKKCIPGRSRGNSFRKNNYRTSGCSRRFLQVVRQYCSKSENIYLLIMVMIMISLPLMTKVQTLSIT